MDIFTSRRTPASSIFALNIPTLFTSRLSSIHQMMKNEYISTQHCRSLVLAIYLCPRPSNHCKHEYGKYLCSFTISAVGARIFFTIFRWHWSGLLSRLKADWKRNFFHKKITALSRFVWPKWDWLARTCLKIKIYWFEMLDKRYDELASFIGCHCLWFSASLALATSIIFPQGQISNHENELPPIP